MHGFCLKKENIYWLNFIWNRPLKVVAIKMLRYRNITAIFYLCLKNWMKQKSFGKKPKITGVNLKFCYAKLKNRNILRSRKWPKSKSHPDFSNCLYFNFPVVFFL